MNEFVWHNDWCVRRIGKYLSLDHNKNIIITGSRVYEVYHRHYKNESNRSTFTITTDSESIERSIVCGVCMEPISPIEIKKLLLLNL